MTPLITHMRKDCHCASARVAAAIGHFQPALFVHGPALLQTMPRFLPDDQQLFSEHVRAHAFSVASPTLASHVHSTVPLGGFPPPCANCVPGRDVALTLSALFLTRSLSTWAMDRRNTNIRVCGNSCTFSAARVLYQTNTSLTTCS